METKKCDLCGIEKEIEDYNYTYKNELNNLCSRCVKAEAGRILTNLLDKAPKFKKLKN